jgi:FkbM family methyltransferase
VRDFIHRLVRGLGFDLIRYPGGTGYGVGFAQLIDRLGADVVIDVGAHVGEFASVLRERGYAGRMVSFEPVSDSFDRLQRRARLDPLWETHSLALGEQREQKAINVTVSSDLASFLPVSERGRRHFGALIERAKNQELVDVVRLDEVFDDLIGDVKRAVMKVDTQGWDMAVLRGATGVLDRIVGLQVEMAVNPYYDRAPSYLDVLQWLRAFGFEPTGFFPVTWDEGVLAEIDCTLQRVSTRSP